MRQRGHGPQPHCHKRCVGSPVSSTKHELVLDLAASLCAVRLREQHLADAHEAGRQFDALVLAAELQGLLERQLLARDERYEDVAGGLTATARRSPARSGSHADRERGGAEAFTRTVEATRDDEYPFSRTAQTCSGVSAAAGAVSVHLTDRCDASIVGGIHPSARSSVFRASSASPTAQRRSQFRRGLLADVADRHDRLAACRTGLLGHAVPSRRHGALEPE